MGKLSCILTSKDIRGIWKSLQESVGKETACSHKTRIFNGVLKWKMLVILPLQRSNELCSHLLCTGSHGHLSHPFPPRGRDIPAPLLSPSLGGGTASPQHILASRGDEGREAAVAPGTAAAKSPFPLSRSVNEVWHHLDLFIYLFIILVSSSAFASAAKA